MAGRHFLCLLAATFCLSESPAETPPFDPEKDPHIGVLLSEANNLAANKKPEQAIEKCDKVIQVFTNYYQDRSEKVYCARSTAERLGYLAQAALDKRKAVVLSPAWAEAYFLKGYCMQELSRLPEAKENLLQALALSPFSSQYLSELGSILQLEKDWSEAKRVFKQAQDHSRLSPADLMASELGRGRRGFAYCLIEEGDLNSAEEIYYECLKADPKDARARNELRYIQSLRAKEEKADP